MITVHMIGNAHLDPVWLWQRAEGVDTALATARSACDRLDEYPDFVFTCSASWFHEQVQRLDPALFERVRAFVRAGRWATVGGMVIQPDCNLPSAAGFARQLAVGQAYYRREFGHATTVGYNVDSFGHTAYLPRMLREAGIDAYVFMRPGPHEMTLPASLFRWQSPDGHEVAAFRIAGAYCTWADDLRQHVQATLAAAAPGIDHTMCFFGVGDHGGGPTRAQIEWVRANRDAFPGARLVFSHPRAFFDAVADRLAALPAVQGELQHHAIGCYAVERRIKVAMRRAESRLAQAEDAAAMLPDAADPDIRPTLDRAWDAVLFNQFHDMLGGTCLPDASAAVAGELTAAESAADAVLTTLTRRTMRREARPGEHRIALVNPAAEPFDGYVTHEPWCPPDPFSLVDEDGRAVAFQVVERRAKVTGRRLLFRVSIPARGRRMLRIVKSDGAAPAAPAHALECRPAPGGPPEPVAHIANRHARCDFSGDTLRLADWILTLDVCDDPSDTWAHSCINRFGGEVAGRFEFRSGWEAVEAGPIRAAVRGRGTFGNSRVWLRAMMIEGEPMLRLHVAVVWAEVQRLLRLRVAAPATLGQRVDLVSGGPLARPLNGLEYPLNGAMVVAAGAPDQGGTPASLAVIAPEVFSVSADPQGLSLTLLRSPYAAHHDPFPAAQRPDHPVTDQGLHEFDILLAPGAPLDLSGPSRLAREMLAPPIVWDLAG